MTSMNGREPSRGRGIGWQLYRIAATETFGRRQAAPSPLWPLLTPGFWLLLRSSVQRIDLRGHDEVIPMQVANFMGPQSYGYASPFR